MIGRLAAYVAASDSPQFWIDNRYEILQCLLVTVAPSRQQRANLPYPFCRHTAGDFSTLARKVCRVYMKMAGQLGSSIGLHRNHEVVCARALIQDWMG